MTRPTEHPLSSHYAELIRLFGDESRYEIWCHAGLDGYWWRVFVDGAEFGGETWTAVINKLTARLHGNVERAVPVVAPVQATAVNMAMTDDYGPQRKYSSGD